MKSILVVCQSGCVCVCVTLTAIIQHPAIESDPDLLSYHTLQINSSMLKCTCIVGSKGDADAYSRYFCIGRLNI